MMGLFQSTSKKQLKEFLRRMNGNLLERNGMYGGVARLMTFSKLIGSQAATAMTIVEEFDHLHAQGHEQIDILQMIDSHRYAVLSTVTHQNSPLEPYMGTTGADGEESLALFILHIIEREYPDLGPISISVSYIKQVMYETRAYIARYPQSGMRSLQG